MEAGEEVVLILRYKGIERRFKFFRGTTQAELLNFCRELLSLPSGVQFHLLDKDGDPVLVNSCVPNRLQLTVAVTGDDTPELASLPDASASVAEQATVSNAQCSASQTDRIARTSEQILLDVVSSQALVSEQSESELLPLLLSTERISKLACAARRRLLDSLGLVQVRRLVFRADTPVHVRQIIFGFSTAAQVVHFAEVSRNFFAWVSWEGRRILPVIDDRVLRGGVEAARKLARRVHPGFLHSVIAERECVAACAFLDAITQKKFKVLSYLKEVRVANTQYVPAELLIRILRQAGCIEHVALLTRLEKPLPPVCLRSVRCLEPLVIHATELHGFPSLFAGSSASALQHVVIRDTCQLDFNSLLGVLELDREHGLGNHVKRLEIVPHGCEPVREWEKWIRPVAELLGHPALAAIEYVAVPAPCSSKLAAAAMNVLCLALREKGAPKGLKTLEFLPYKTEHLDFTLEEGDHDVTRRIRSLLDQCRSDWPYLEIIFPGIRASL